MLLAGGKVGVRLCVQGTSDVLINGSLYKISRGVSCFVSPMVSFFEMSKSADYRFVELVDDMEVFYGMFRKIFDIIIRIRVWSSPCFLLDEEHIALFLQRRERIMRRRQEQSVAATREEAVLLDHICRLLEQETIVELLRFYLHTGKISPQPTKRGEAKVFRFIGLLQKHYRTERGVAFYAGECGVSTSHFCRVVKEYTGKTPSEWIAAITMLNAKAMLENSELSIKDIACELNFPEQFTFRKYFKQYAGIPPTEYRKKMMTQKQEDWRGRELTPEVISKP